jgi:anti-sigma B factor antagonist
MTARQTTSNGTQQLLIREQLLTVRITECPGAVVVHVSGEIDFCTAPTLSTCLTTQLHNSNPPPVLVLDLAEVSFLSCAGLRVLFETQYETTQRGTMLCLVSCSAAVHRLLGLPSLHREFSIYPSLTDALPRLAPETIPPS